LGKAPAGAPEVVVVELLGRRLLEGEHLAPLGIHARHHVLDGAVLAGGVHGLEDQEQRPAVVRVEPLLQIAQALDALDEALLGVLLGLEARGVGGIAVLQLELAVRVDPELLETGHRNMSSRKFGGRGVPSPDSAFSTANSAIFSTAHGKW